MKSYFAALVVSVAGVCLCSPVKATVISMQHTAEFSGAFEPQGLRPWLTTTFDDGDTPGSVTITLENTGLVGSEFVSKWYLNVAGGFLYADGLTFTPSASTGPFLYPSVQAKADGFKAAGAGHFDVRLGFSTGGGTDARFGAGESLAITVDDGGMGILVASDLDLPCSPVSAKQRDRRELVFEPQGLPVAAHVQSIGPNGSRSGWVSVSTPEPASLGLMALGALLMQMRWRFRS